MLLQKQPVLVTRLSRYIYIFWIRYRMLSDPFKRDGEALKYRHKRDVHLITVKNGFFMMLSRKFRHSDKLTCLWMPCTAY